MSDQELLTKYLEQRNVQAFNAFVSRHQDCMLTFAAGILRDESGAQDVVQEALLRVARYPERLLKSARAGWSERNWLLKVVRDLCIDAKRRRGAELRAVGAVQRPAEAAPAVEAALESAERMRRVLAAVDRLPARQRELVILKVQEQKSYKEIAQITGLTATNVGFLLYQAMRQLNQELGQGL